MVAFIIWSIAGCCFILLGIFSFISKKPIGFWANVKMFEVNDIRQYNNAMGKLWCSFGILFIVLGLPLLYGQNSPLVIISILGTMFETIVYMIIYTQVIERKYNTARQKKD
ncbi:MAG: hypothetical protein K2G45_05660 [Lachnospiraceae bacterium]|nr:hypothetical protein [Lachnospiraceae bacterium]